VLSTLPWEKWHAAARSAETLSLRGRVRRVIGLTIESEGPRANIGDVCLLLPHPRRAGEGTEPPIRAEVVGFKDQTVLLMPLGDMRGVGPGTEVISTNRPFVVGVGPALQGRVITALGTPADGLGAIEPEEWRLVDAPPPVAMERRRIHEPLPTGVKAIDGVLTCGRGQRLGIFAGSGVGKSTLLGMIARYTAADVNVIALVGERGREVREFLEKDLREGLSHSVVVVATSDQPALLRIKAALVATTVAEYFRDQGKDVLLIMDSVTRFAMAQREVGLAIGEPPATRGYTPSVFALLPRVLERAGTAKRGSITGIYSVLVEGDDTNEPISDAVRGILDGHIVLSRDLAAQNHYPPIDVLQSVSRLLPDIASPEHLAAAGKLRSVLATYKDAEDLISIGAYSEGSNPEIDYARAHIGKVRAFLRQRVDEKVPFDQVVASLRALFEEEVA